MTAESQATTPKPDEARGRSTIEFPYFDLTSALEVAQAVKQVGGTAADWKQLAVKLNMTAEGGGFRSRMMTAKTFGLLDYDRGHVELTELGLRAVDPQFERAARVDAFMAVPLYKALFEKLNGQTLPPAAAVERMAEQLGVAPKQKDKARLAFMRSAKTAGLFEISAERLSLPPSLNQGPPKAAAGPDFDGEETTRRKGGGNGSGPNLPPFIQGLIDKLPEPESQWDLAGRAKWLTTAANIFDLMYSADDETAGITITLKGSTLSITTGASS